MFLDAQGWPHRSRPAGAPEVRNFTIDFYYQNDCILNQKDALVRGGLETPEKVANK